MNVMKEAAKAAPQSDHEAIAKPEEAKHAAITDNDDLVVRRERLKMRSEVLRHRLTLRSGGLKPAFRASDRFADGVDWVKHNPAILAVAGAAVVGAVLARPRSVARLGTRAFALWQVFQRVQPLVRSMMRRM